MGQVALQSGDGHHTPEPALLPPSTAQQGLVRVLLQAGRPLGRGYRGGRQQFSPAKSFRKRTEHLGHNPTTMECRRGGAEHPPRGTIPPPHYVVPPPGYYSSQAGGETPCASQTQPVQGRPGEEGGQACGCVSLGGGSGGDAAGGPHSRPRQEAAQPRFRLCGFLSSVPAELSVESLEPPLRQGFERGLAPGMPTSTLKMRWIWPRPTSLANPGQPRIALSAFLPGMSTFWWSAGGQHSGQHPGQGRSHSLWQDRKSFPSGLCGFRFLGPSQVPVTGSTSRASALPRFLLQGPSSWDPWQRNSSAGVFSEGKAHRLH